MNPSQARHNAKVAEKARKRRAMYYRLHITNGLSVSDLARRYKVSRQCMSVMLRRAKEDAS